MKDAQISEEDKKRLEKEAEDIRKQEEEYRRKEAELEVCYTHLLFCKNVFESFTKANLFQNSCSGERASGAVECRHDRHGSHEQITDQ